MALAIDSGPAPISTTSGDDIQYLDLAAPRIDPIDDAKVADPKGPIALEGPDQRLAQFRLIAQPFQGAVDAFE